MIVRRAASATAVAAAVLLLAACGGSSGGGKARSSAATSGPVTQAQADRLAIVRFNLYRGTGARVTASLVSDGQPVRVTADVDFRRHLGYGVVGNGSSGVVVQWSPTTIDVWQQQIAGAAPATLPTQRPVTRALSAQSRVDVVLRLVLDLGFDRPDNSQLLRRNGAEFLRSDTLRGVKVDVLRGPKATGGTTQTATTRYWVDARGNLLRFEAQLGGQGALAPIDIEASAYRTFTIATGLTVS